MPQLKMFEDNESTGAKFSECRGFRKYLWRIWDKEKPMVMFIGLNPSTANETGNDKTISRLIGFARSMNFGGMYMTNLFERVDKNPSGLKGYLDFISENENLFNIRKLCDKVVFCWGAFKVAKQRAEEVIKLFPDAYCFGFNDDGTPKHPLFLRADTQLVKFKNLTNEKSN